MKYLWRIVVGIGIGYAYAIAAFTLAAHLMAQSA